MVRSNVKLGYAVKYGFRILYKHVTSKVAFAAILGLSAVGCTTVNIYTPDSIVPIQTSCYPGIVWIHVPEQQSGICLEITGFGLVKGFDGVLLGYQHTRAVLGIPTNSAVIFSQNNNGCSDFRGIFIENIGKINE